jgi:hypothetical protein
MLDAGKPAASCILYPAHPVNPAAGRKRRSSSTNPSRESDWERLVMEMREAAFQPPLS